MAREKLTNQLVEAGDGGYYTVTVSLRKKDSKWVATIPGMGVREVKKEWHERPEPHEDFAWKIVK